MDILEKITSCRLWEQDPFCQLVMKMPILVVIYKLDGTTIFVNEAVIDIIGYTPEEIMKFDWREVLIPEKELKKQTEDLAEILQKTEVHSYESEMIHKDGHTVHILWNETMFDGFENGEDVYFSFGIDISPVKEIEKELKKANSNSNSLQMLLKRE
jgi:PAS domain S-box-containing protein